MRRSTFPHLVSLLGAFVAVSVVLGLIGAGLLIPVAGAGGTAAKATVQGFNDLDDEWTANPLAQQSRIFSADNKLLATPYDANRIVVPLKKISPNMRKAQLAIEDSRFFEHGGIDVRGTSRAFFSNLTSGQTQGGSSITQQYVKIMLQEKAIREGDKDAAQAAVEQTYSRKLQELKYALNIEKTQTKNQILSSYLNLVYYGDQAYGVEAASLHFFSKHASKLSISEAATLAGVVQSPGRFNIRTNPEEVQERRDLVIDRMERLGWITHTEAVKAKKPSVESLVKIKHNEGGTCSKAVDPYFCNYVIAYLRTMPELGPDPDARMLAINTGGLRIKTTLRRDWQKEMHAALSKKVPAGDPKVGAAGAIVEPGTGKVRAIAQTSEYKVGRKKATTKYSEQAWTVPNAYGGTTGFAIGSTAKIYALVAALEQGMPLESTVDAPFAAVRKPATFYSKDFDPKCTTGAPWEVQNDYAVGGRQTLAQATKMSINTAFAQLASDIGSCNIPKAMDKMGLRDGNNQKYGLLPDSQQIGKKLKDDYAIANIVLGSDSTTPLQLAASYASLAADGKFCPANPIESITTATGKKIKITPPKCHQAMSKDVARGVTQLMRGPLEPGGTAGAAALDGGRPAAGKTGTTENHGESWFAGFTPQVSTAIWVGTPFGDGDAYEMDNISIGGQYYRNVFGGTIAAPLWKQVMDDVSEGMDKKSFPKPGEKTLKGDVRDIPNVSGMGPDQARQTLEKAGFKAQVGNQVNSTVQAGGVAYTQPSGQALKGATVTMYISNGAPPYTPPPPPPPTTQAPPPAPAPSSPTPKPTTTSATKPSTPSSKPKPSPKPKTPPPLTKTKKKD